MKIVHLIPSLACGGGEILMGNIAIEQAQTGHEVNIIVLEKLTDSFLKYPLKDKFKNLVKIIEMDVNISFSFLKNELVVSNKSFDEFLTNFQPEIVHSHLFMSELISRNNLLAGVKYFTHCHNNMPQFNFLEKKKFKRRITDFREYKWLMKKYMECGNHFITISKDTQAFYKKWVHSTIRDHIYFLKNGINTSIYYSNKEKINEPIFQLITVGTLLKNKGHSFLIDCVNELVNEGIEIQLSIVGDGPEMAELAGKIEMLGLKKNIFLVGNVGNVNDYLSQAHLYVHAAFKEAFGLVLIEAMASELPVIATNGGGNKDLIINDYNGYLIESRDVEEFNKKIKFLLNNPAARLKLGENAIDFSKSFDIKEYVIKLHEMYLK